MIKTQIIPCRLSTQICDKLNSESGEVFSRVMVEHWRRYRKKGVWLNHFKARKYDDYLAKNWEHILPSNAIDNAQEAFYKACKTARTNKGSVFGVRYPHKRKRYMTTVWNGDANVRVEDGKLRLSTAKGIDSLYHPLPDGLADTDIVEVRLVFNRNHYELHLVCDDMKEKPDPPGDGILALDLGIIHPAVSYTGDYAQMFVGRELLANAQYKNKRLASIVQEQSRHKKGSSRWRKLQRRKRKVLAKNERRQRDMLHKFSRAIVDYAVEQKCGTIVMGDLKDIADGKRLRKKEQQKLSQWPRGKFENYIEYKAKEVGIQIKKISEAYTSQTCPVCGKRTKPRGRRYRCSACGFQEHRDIVGAMNIYETYRSSPNGYERSPLITGQVARYGVNHITRGTSLPFDRKGSPHGGVE